MIRLRHIVPRYFEKVLRCHVLVLPLLILSSSAYAQTPDLDQVLGRIITAYGGEENLRKLDAHVQEWDVVALMGNRHGTDMRTIHLPDRLKVKLRYPDTTETRIVDGEHSLVLYRGQPARSAGHPQRDAMRLQLMRLYSPLVLREKLDFLDLTVDGEFCVITLFEHGVRADYVVNTNNWHIEKVVGTVAIKGREMQFLTEYSSFAFQDGVLVHERENKFAGGVNTAVLRLRRIVFDADLNDSDFLPDEEPGEQPGKDQDDII